MTHWTTSDIPPQKGRSAIVTGTGGIGLEVALALAQAGGDIIIAGRSPRKGADAVAKVRAVAPAATVRFEQVDLASLKSIADFGARLRSQRDSLDLLINNAAVMNPPKREKTMDGFELQFGTNYLGHFALTAHVLPLLRSAKKARVVTLSSIAAGQGAIHFDDLQAEKGYDPMRVYAQSKLACLMFALELQRRSEASRWGVTSIAAHPGISRTDLLHNAPGRWSARGMARTFLWFLFQPAAQGALPALYAATAPGAKGGEYYGPTGLGETRGATGKASLPEQARDTRAASHLWETSERLARVTFPEPDPAPGADVVEAKSF
jgi:NAD(P)-dependent dehydrogenase (short-subunit alcohol dehydrogenase family)